MQAGNNGATAPKAASSRDAAPNGAAPSQLTPNGATSATVPPPNPSHTPHLCVQRLRVGRVAHHSADALQAQLPPVTQLRVLLAWGEFQEWAQRAW